MRQPLPWGELCSGYVAPNAKGVQMRFPLGNIYRSSATESLQSPNLVHPPTPPPLHFFVRTLPPQPDHPPLDPPPPPGAPPRPPPPTVPSPPSVPPLQPHYFFFFYLFRYVFFFCLFFLFFILFFLVFFEVFFKIFGSCFDLARRYFFPPFPFRTCFTFCSSPTPPIDRIC